MATQKSDLKLDAFVEYVRPDPKSNEQVQLLQGYLGKSSEADHVRVYFDEELNNFVDLPKADILCSMPNDKAENPLGGSRLWVKKATVVTVGDPSSANRAKSTFLEGDVLSAYGNMGLGAFNNSPGGPGPVLSAFCPTDPSLGNTTCISNNPPCPTTNIFCRSNFCPPSVPGPCHFTIVNPTCLKPSCNATCLQPSCIRTCQQVSCFINCTRQTLNIRSCAAICVDTIKTPCQVQECQFGSNIPTPQSLACDTRTPFLTRTIEINPGFAAQQQAFQGTFNPFNTGGFGM